MGNVSLSSVALAGVNKGEIKREGEYYYMCLGALNIFNSAGDYYDAEGSRAAFAESSAFNRLIVGGNMYGEDNHPKREGWMSDEDFYRRNDVVDVDHRSVFVREIFFIPNGEICNNLPVIEIWGWIKPFGTKGPDLKAALDDPHQNVCFSIRCWCLDKRVNGVTWWAIDEPICFDWVPEPGLCVANMFYAEHGHKIQNDKLPKRLMFENYSVPLTDATLIQMVKRQKEERVSGDKYFCTESRASTIATKYAGRVQGINVASGGLIDTPMT